MIVSMRGMLVAKSPPYLTLEVAGVGYELQAPMCTFYHLPKEGEEVSLHTFQIFRDNHFNLFAFLNSNDKMAFCELIKLNKIGPKVALIILSHMDAFAFKNCVLEEDSERLSCLPGVGAKTAKRIIFEMRPRLSKDCWAAVGEDSEALSFNDVLGDAQEALLALGYKAREARMRVEKINAKGLSLEQIIQRALSVG